MTTPERLREAARLYTIAADHIERANALVSTPGMSAPTNIGAIAYACQGVDDDEGYSCTIEPTAVKAVSRTCEALDDHADSLAGGAPYRLLLARVQSVALSSLVDLDDDDDGEPPNASDILEGPAFSGATEFSPCLDDWEWGDEAELDRVLALPRDERAAALDEYASRVWPTGWWPVLVDELLVLGPDADAWVLPEWATEGGP